jgi:putative endonuclease
MSELCLHTAPDVPASHDHTNSSPNSNWFVYLIRTASGVLYTGISTDPVRRLRQHQGEIAGGAKALRGKGPLQLVWQYQAPNRSVASQWEFQLKKLPKKAKEQLVSLLWQPEFLLLGMEGCHLATVKNADNTEVNNTEVA